MAPRELALNCLLFGDDPENDIFVVHVAIVHGTVVADLKDAIKAKKPIALANVDANNLRLWKVSIPFDAQLTQAVEHYVYEDRPLRPLEQVAGLFDNPGPLKQHLHTLVRKPGDKQVAVVHGYQPDVGGEHLRRRALEKRFQQLYILKAIKSPPPSSAAASKLNKIQETPMGLLNGRPLQNHGLPIELYHPTFDEFKIALKESTPMAITHVNYHDVIALCAGAADIYATEQDREARVYPLLETILSVNLVERCADEYNSTQGGRVITLESRGSLAFLAVLKMKNEIGAGHCDPAIQASFSYRDRWMQAKSRSLVNSSNCPSFLVAIAGPHIRILGAVFTRSVIVKPLTDWIQLDIDPADDTKLERLARVLLALCASLKSLRRYYEGLAMDNNDLNDDWFFPYICSYPGADKQLVGFRYVKKLAEADSAKPIFKAQIGDEGPFIVVKFVQRYNTDAHRLLASLDLAPKLLYSGFDEGNTYGNCGSLKMVVMEFVEGQTAYDITKPLSVKQFDQVQTAVKTLHTEGFVFGDLRLPNIMLNGEIAKLVDFDWCGKEETGRYPITVNNDIRWHADVRRGGPMAKEHDDFMLQEIPRLW